VGSKFIFPSQHSFPGSLFPHIDPVFNASGKSAIDTPGIFDLFALLPAPEANGESLGAKGRLPLGLFGGPKG